MAAMADDPYLWLEDIAGDDALDWVRRVQPRRVFEPDPEVLSTERIGEVDAGRSGIFAILQGPPSAPIP